MDTVTHSIDIDTLTLEELVMLNQGLGRQMDELREKRAYVSAKIAARLKADQRDALIRDAEERLQAINGTAPGAVIEATGTVV